MGVERAAVVVGELDLPELRFLESEQGAGKVEKHCLDRHVATLHSAPPAIRAMPTLLNLSEEFARVWI
ncbi:hypothetical protein Ntsu_31400 [Nocardia sp. IFM 10818]